MPSNSIKDANESSVAFLRSTPFLKRFITGVIFASIGLGGVYLGPPYSHVLFGMIAIALMAEWMHMIWRSKYAWSTKVIWEVLGIFYIGAGVWGVYHYYLLKPLQCIMLLFTICTTDIGAYFFGQIIGGPKLWPSVSPNKTWSGSIGGFFSAIIVMLIFMWLFPDLRSFLLFISFLLLSIVGQLGDLLESYVKRIFQVKDTGSLLPGHGGFLDRFDSPLAVGVVLLIFYIFLQSSYE